MDHVIVLCSNIVWKQIISMIIKVTYPFYFRMLRELQELVLRWCANIKCILWFVKGFFNWKLVHIPQNSIAVSLKKNDEIITKATRFCSFLETVFLKTCESKMSTSLVTLDMPTSKVLTAQGTKVYVYI